MPPRLALLLRCVVVGVIAVSFISPPSYYSSFAHESCCKKKARFLLGEQDSESDSDEDSSDEDSTDYFTVDDNGLEVVDSEYLINGPEEQQDAGKALLSLHKLFSPFIINRAELLCDRLVHSHYIFFFGRIALY